MWCFLSSKKSKMQGCHSLKGALLNRTQGTVRSIKRCHKSSVMSFPVSPTVLNLLNTNQFFKISKFISMFLGDTEIKLMIHIKLPGMSSPAVRPGTAPGNTYTKFSSWYKATAVSIVFAPNLKYTKANNPFYPQIIWVQVMLMSTRVQHLITVLNWVQIKLCREV